MGLAFGTFTEDMDALTFGSKRVYRGFNKKQEAKSKKGAKAMKESITQIDLDATLKGLDMIMDEFIDLCILYGCDYTQKIRGIGPCTAFDFVTDHRNIETILNQILEINEGSKKGRRSRSTTSRIAFCMLSRELSSRSQM